MVKPITSFSGPNAFLSNFYVRAIWFKGILYQSAEHAFQAQKAWTIVDHDYIREAASPAEAKRRGKTIARIDSWEEIKVQTMLDVLRAKFANHHPNGAPNTLAEWLYLTGEAELVEGNTWGDVFWGQCPLGNGENMLGKLLMQVREELRG
jgi:N-glycosidase YbiA